MKMFFRKKLNKKTKVRYELTSYVLVLLNIVFCLSFFTIQNMYDVLNNLNYIDNIILFMFTINFCLTLFLNFAMLLREISLFNSKNTKVKKMCFVNLARFMHDRYEHNAKYFGWKTQETCKVNFEDLPLRNKATMLCTAKDILEKLK